MDLVQRNRHTQLLRYPNLLATAKAYLQTSRREGPLKILSFGCSIGDEVASLKLAFPQAELYGCDVDDDALRIAEASVGHMARIFKSDGAAIRRHGPFDLVLALSCLCVHPKPKGDFSAHFPFSRFEDLVGLLGDVVTPWGALVIYNASYLFQASSASAGFVPIRSDVICRSGFVALYDTAGEMMVRSDSSPIGTPIRGVMAGAALSDYDLVDCVFAKTGATAPIPLRLYDDKAIKVGGYAPGVAWSRSELDGLPVERRAEFIDMIRRYRTHANAAGEVLYECDVVRTSLDGSRELKLATYGPAPVLVTP